MNRRDFLAAISAAYGVALLPPRLTPAGDADFVAAAEEAAVVADRIDVTVVLIDEEGCEHLPKKVPFIVERVVAYGHEAVTFKAVEAPTWAAVSPPLVVARIAALIPFGEVSHRVYFPMGRPIYANGGDLTVEGLKAVLA
jgi:hypothetical protein